MEIREVESYLKGLEQKLLLNENWQRIKLTREWTDQFSTDAGVYLIRESKENCEDKEICYVGETGSIRARMGNLLRTQQHVIRRMYGNAAYKDHSGFEKATSRIRFTDEIEEKINQWMENNLEISVLEVNLGRKELEKRICDNYNPKYNNRQ